MCHAPVPIPEECVSSAAVFLLLRVFPHDLLSRSGYKETNQFSLRSRVEEVLDRTRHKLASQHIVLPHIDENMF